jgi:hypothetical protein
MGNCLQSGRVILSRKIEEQFIKIKKVDGKILEYRAPLFVKDLLMDNDGHAVVNCETSCHQLSPEYELLPGQIYFLVPNNSSGVSSNDGGEKINQKGQEGALKPAGDKELLEKNGVIRVKIVITKRQLEEMLSKSISNRKISIEDMMIEFQSKSQLKESAREDPSVKPVYSGWRPSLESISEG